ncbi:DJ-1/PfpI family protein [Candidatus Uabimicrobium sp. HlEnr_7]|uniref:DJ-1/PfpI family protein n=1 Tax=Candidatus Uabimicrobium helgolandensis TaxID=3095367 RepID=UPI00355862E5
MKRLYFVLLALFISCCAYTEEPAKKILMLVSDGFHPKEYYTPRDLFEKSKYKIEVASKYLYPVLPDRRKIAEYPAIIANITFKKVDVSKYDAIVFVGGNGAWEDFFPNEDIHKILTDAMKQNKIVALICSATGLLGVANNLDGKGNPVAKGKKVTGYKRVVGLLVVMGKVKFSPGKKGKPHVVIDGNLITARDPISAKLFAETIVKHLEVRN